VEIAMDGREARARSRGLTLVELLTVVGLIALLFSLFMPVLVKVRAAAATTACLAQLRQMGTAWTMYAAESRGRLPEYASYTFSTPDAAWCGYWPGVLEQYEVRGATLLCPAAREPTVSAANLGFGNAASAWTGEYATNGSVIRFDENMFRVSSYGYNTHLTAGGGFGRGGGASGLGAVRNASDVPAFMDCAFADVRPGYYGTEFPAPPPPNLTGEAITRESPNHWRILLSRHGRGINMFMADGSGKWVRLDDLYLLRWAGDWKPYRLTLPTH
jgi:prepilin-type processing-associated H-X9-DG protein